MVADVATKRTVSEGHLHTAQQKRKLRSLRAYITVCFIEYYPFQCALGFLQNGCVFRSHQHIFQHGCVGKKDRGRTCPQLIAGEYFIGVFFFMSRQTFGSSSVVEAKADVAAKASRPGIEPVSLATDECVERVEKKGTYTLQRAAEGCALSG